MATSVDIARLGRRIRKLRQQRGLSQEDVAAPKYTAAYISHVENGKRRASQEALSHIAERLGLTAEQLVTGRDPHADLQLEVQAQRAIAQIHAGEVDQALDLLEDVRRSALSAGHQPAAAQAELGLGLALRLQGRSEEALGAYQRAAKYVAEEIPERRTSAVTGQARCLFQLGELREAIHLLESHLIELHRRDDTDPAHLVETYAALIPPYFESGMIDKAKDTATKGWALAPRIPDLEQRACLYVNRAQLMLTQGDHREALMSLALAEDAYRHLGWTSEAAKVTLGRALVLIDEEDYNEAEKLLRCILVDDGQLLSHFDRVKTQTQLALVRRVQGAPEEGIELARRALKKAGRRFPVLAAEAEREVGLCAMSQGDASSALKHWRGALKSFIKFNDNEEAAKTARLIGDFLTEAGNHEEASAAYRDGLGAISKLR